MLDKLLPNGNIVGWVKYSDDPKRGVKNYWADTYDELLSRINHAYGTYNVYVGFFNFEDRKRTEKNAGVCNVIWLDIDCEVSKTGKERDYPTKEEGLIALGKFCETLQINLPNIIDTGWGLHCIWHIPTIQFKQWQPVQRGLGFLTQKIGLKVDTQALTNPAIGTRPIGSYNIRETEVREVKLLYETNNKEEKLPEYIIRLAHALGYVPEVAKAQSTNIINKQIGNALLPNQLPSADGNLIPHHCEFLRTAIAMPTEVNYNLWFRIAGIAKYVQNGLDFFKLWSSADNRYNEQDTEKKFNDWSGGPVTCESIKRECEGTIFKDICGRCPLYKKITTPIQAGVNYVEEPKDNEPVYESPQGYHRNDTHGVISTTKEGVQQVITPYNVWLENIAYDATTHARTVELCWNTRHTNSKQKRIRVPIYELMPGHNNAGDVLAKHGIVIRSKQEIQSMTTYFANFILNMERQQEDIKAYTHFGWQDDNEFLLGRTLYYEEHLGQITKSQVPVSFEFPFTNSIHAKGDINNWRTVINMLDNPELGGHAFSFYSGLAALPMKFLGLGSVSINLEGTSGGGKSLVHKMVNSIIGHPSDLFMYVHHTQYSVFKTMTLLRNICGVLDDIGNMDSQLLSNYIYTLAHGVDRQRLNQRGDFKELGRWATVIQTSSNHSLSGKLFAIKSSPVAELMRMMEVHITPTNKIAEIGGYIDYTLRHNYGVAADYIIPALLKQAYMLEAYLRNERPQVFENKYGFTFQGRERFWQGMIIAADYMAELCNKIGLLNINYERAIEWGLHQVESNRNNINDNVSDPFDLISNFIYSNIGTIFIQSYTEKYEPMAAPISDARYELKMHMELIKNSKGAVTGGSLFIRYDSLSKWLTEIGSSMQYIKNEMSKQGLLLNIKRKKLGNIGGVTQVIGIDLNHSRFANIRDLQAYKESNETTNTISTS